MKALFQKYREYILYIFFGGLTTLVNIVAYYVVTRYAAIGVSAATIISWALSVLFAYVTNRKWVFISRQSGARGVLREMGSFFLARAATGALDLLIMQVFVKSLHFNDMLIKILSNILVIILNYVFSKLWIFKKKGTEET